MNLRIYKAKEEEALTIAKLAIQMWEDASIEELTEGFVDVINSAEGVVFLGEIDGQKIGFAQCQLRQDYVEGTETSPVGYLEGIFIEEEYRKRGYAKQLLATCENWAREQGCTEFASDCELDNTESLKFHLSLGFEEVNRVICFTKNLDAAAVEVEKGEENITYVEEKATFWDADAYEENLNKIYQRLEMKQAELFNGLFHRVFELKSGYYSGNYHRNKAGEYEMDFFPIPVVDVKGYCDVEVNLDYISVSTKLTKIQAMEYDFEKLKKYSFEVYGVEEYLEDYYKVGMTTEELHEAIKKSKEKELGISFHFDFSTTGQEIYEFVKMLRREGFFY